MIYEAGKATVNTQPIKRYHLLKLVTIHDVGRDLVNHGYRDKKVGIWPVYNLYHKKSCGNHVTGLFIFSPENSPNLQIAIIGQ